MNEEDENDGKGHGGSSDFDDEDDIGMGRGGGGDDWEDDKPRQPTPAYVNRLYKPRTPPTWPTPSEGATGFGSRSQFSNREGMNAEQQKKWDAHATIRKKEFSRDSRVDRLAFLGEKARGEMPLKWVVTAKWATEIIVRIADDCTTGAAQQRIQEKYSIDGTKNGTMEMFVPINQRNPKLVGLPEIPLEERVKARNVNLHPKHSEKTVDRKEREELEFIQEQKKREQALRNRRKEIRKVIKKKRIELQEKKIKDDEMRASHAEESEKVEIERKEHARMKKEHLTLEIAAFKQRQLLKKKEKMTQALLVQDVAKRHYQIRFKSFPKQKKQVDVGGGGEQFNLEELNRRRKEAKLKRRASMAKMNQAKVKEEEERKKIEEQLRRADDPLDRLSIKLHYELRKNLFKLSDIFIGMDSDGSGTLTYKEFRKGLFNVGIKLSTKEAITLCEGLDKDGDKEINYKELARFLAQTKNGEESAAMQIQARLRANKVKTKTLAQKKADFEAAKAAKHQADMIAKTVEWEAEQKKIAEEGNSEFHVGQAAAGRERAERERAEREEREEREEEERLQREKRRKEEEKEEEEEKEKKAQLDQEAKELAKQEKLLAKDEEEEDDDDPFGLDSEDDDVVKEEEVANEEEVENKEEEMSAEDIMKAEEDEMGDRAVSATPEQIANWDTIE